MGRFVESTSYFRLSNEILRAYTRLDKSGRLLVQVADVDRAVALA